MSFKTELQIGPPPSNRSLTRAALSNTRHSQQSRARQRAVAAAYKGAAVISDGPDFLFAIGSAKKPDLYIMASPQDACVAPVRIAGG